MNFSQLLYKASLFQKLSQDLTGAIQQVLSTTLQSIPGAKLLNLNVSEESKRVDARIEVPQQHSFTASQLGSTLSEALTQVAPGFQVVPVLSFKTTTASKKQAQDATQEKVKALINNVVARLPQSQLTSFVWQPETKHILVDVAVPTEKTFTAQQLGAHLTKAVQELAPGFTVIPTFSF